MSTCADLANNLVFLDCNNPPVAGVAGTGYIINFEDIDLDNCVISSTGVISALVLKAGKYAYSITTDPDGIEPMWKAAPGAYRRDQFEMSMQIKIFDNSPTVKQRIVDVSQGKFVVVLKNNGMKDNPVAPEVKGDNVYEAWGWKTGLIMGADTQRDANDADLGGGINLHLMTSEKRKEPRPPYSIFITSLTLTEAMLDALLEPASPASP